MKLGIIVWKKILVKGLGTVAVAVIVAIPFIENSTTPDAAETSSNEILTILRTWESPLDHSHETSSNPKEPASGYNAYVTGSVAPASGSVRYFAE